MSEKMLVAQALDERDLLKKKINDKIPKLLLVDIKKKNNDNAVMAMMESKKFEDNAKSSYQQVVDLISRYNLINNAIIASNAKTYISTSVGEMSIAAVISFRSRMKATGSYDTKDLFEITLMKEIKRQYDNAILNASAENKRVADQAEAMRLAILGKEQKGKDNQIQTMDLVEAFVRENTTELVDPIKALEKYQEWKDYIDNFMNEIDTLVKVSNATTTIEF